MRAKKSLGQNFLMHAATAERIADAARLTSADTVLEIGPGTGMLTAPLLARAKKVVAVEADRELIPALTEKFSREIADGRLELIHGDIRTCSIFVRPDKDRAGGLLLPEGYVVVANIPYYITGELIRTLLSARHQPRSITLLVQKEVAERIAPRLRSGRARVKESILSLSVKAYGTPKYEFTVPRGAFVPAPGVDSAVLSIRDISRAAFSSATQEERFFALVHAGFAHKRKLLASNLRDAGFPTDGIPDKARAEDLPLSAWLRLSEEI